MFVSGYLFRKHRLSERFNPQLGGLGALAVFVGVCALDLRPFLTADAPAALAGAFAGVLGCVYGAMVLERAGRLAEGLSFVGKHSAGIYLVNQPFAWLVAVVLYQQLHVAAPAYLAGLPVALVLGLAMPVVIEKLILSRSNLLSMLFLGVKLRPSRADCAPHEAQQPLPSEIARGA